MSCRRLPEPGSRARTAGPGYPRRPAGGGDSPERRWRRIVHFEAAPGDLGSPALWRRVFRTSPRRKASFLAALDSWQSGPWRSTPGACGVSSCEGDRLDGLRGMIEKYSSATLSPRTGGRRAAMITTTKPYPCLPPDRRGTCRDNVGLSTGSAPYRPCKYPNSRLSPLRVRISVSG